MTQTHPQTNVFHCDSCYSFRQTKVLCQHWYCKHFNRPKGFIEYNDKINLSSMDLYIIRKQKRHIVLAELVTSSVKRHNITDKQSSGLNFIDSARYTSMVYNWLSVPKRICQVARDDTSNVLNFKVWIVFWLRHSRLSHVGGNGWHFDTFQTHWYDFIWNANANTRRLIYHNVTI